MTLFFSRLAVVVLYGFYVNFNEDRQSGMLWRNKNKNSLSNVFFLQCFLDECYISILLYVYKINKFGYRNDTSLQVWTGNDKLSWINSCWPTVSWLVASLRVSQGFCNLMLKLFEETRNTVKFCKNVHVSDLDSSATNQHLAWKKSEYEMCWFCSSCFLNIIKLL